MLTSERVTKTENKSTSMTKPKTKITGRVLTMMELSKQFVALQAEKRTCEKHGEYTSSLFTIPTSGEKAWSTCPTCMQEKIKQEDADNVRSLVEERNRIREE